MCAVLADREASRSGPGGWGGGWGGGPIGAALNTASFYGIFFRYQEEIYKFIYLSIIETLSLHLVFSR